MLEAITRGSAKLTSLNLSNIGLGYAGIKKIEQWVESLSSLKRLDLSKLDKELGNNMITSEEAQSVSVIIQKSKSLKELSLGIGLGKIEMNLLYDEGIEAIKNGLKEKKTIINLNISPALN